MEFELYSSYFGENAPRVITDVEWVDELELDNASYQFYILLVVKREDGYYLSTDSGCSCPTPWENHTFPESFTGPLTAEQAREESSSLIEGAQETARNGYSEGPDEYRAKALLAKIV